MFAEVVQLDRDLAVRKLTRYLGDALDRWPRRFREPLDDPAT